MFLAHNPNPFAFTTITAEKKRFWTSWDSILASKSGESASKSGESSSKSGKSIFTLGDSVTGSLQAIRFQASTPSDSSFQFGVHCCLARKYAYLILCFTQITPFLNNFGNKNRFSVGHRFDFSILELKPWFFGTYEYELQ